MTFTRKDRERQLQTFAEIGHGTYRIRLIFAEAGLWANGQHELSIGQMIERILEKEYPPREKPAPLNRGAVGERH